MTTNKTEHAWPKVTPLQDAGASPLIQSLQRGLQILEFVARADAPASVTQISRAVALHASTTAHLVRTLAALGYLKRDASARGYRVGPKVFHVAASAWSETHLIEIATSHLTELAWRTCETSSLAILERREVLVVHKVDGPSPVRLAERIGYPRPPHCTATGKILLAGLAEGEIGQVLSADPLEARTPKTITDLRRLRQEIEKVKKQGYALDDEEYVVGLRCLAAPVFDFRGKLVAAIGISGPAWRLTENRLDDLIGVVTSSGRQLSADLGCRHPDGDPTPRA